MRASCKQPRPPQVFPTSLDSQDEGYRTCPLPSPAHPLFLPSTSSLDHIRLSPLVTALRTSHDPQDIKLRFSGRATAPSISSYKLPRSTQAVQTSRSPQDEPRPLGHLLLPDPLHPALNELRLASTPSSYPHDPRPHQRSPWLQGLTCPQATTPVFLPPQAMSEPRVASGSGLHELISTHVQPIVTCKHLTNLLRSPRTSIPC